jgi:hypothetical protein
LREEQSMKLIVPVTRREIPSKETPISVFPLSNQHLRFRRKQIAPEHQKATGWWWLFGSRLRGPLIQRHVEFLAEDGFDSFQIG